MNIAAGRADRIVASGDCTGPIPALWGSY